MKYILFLLTFSILSLNSFSQKYENLSKLYSQKQLDKAFELGLEFYKTDSDNTELNLLLGRILVDKKQFMEAIPYLEKGASKDNTKDWIEAWSLAYLGTAYYITDNYEQSKEVLKKCIRINATKYATSAASKSLNNLLMDKYFDNWEIIDTKHFRFHIQDRKVLGDVDKYITRREKAYLNINKFFFAEPFKKIDFYIWSSRENMKKRLGTESGFAISKICMINANYDQTPGHEIVHVLSDFGIKPSEQSKLINEGIAVYLDQTNRNRMEIARKDINGANVDIIELWNNPKQYPESFIYTVSGAFVGFLLKKGTTSQLKQLLKVQTVEHAKKVYDNFDELIKDFEKELKI